MINDVLIVRDEDIEFIYNSIHNQQLIFHPRIAPEGQIDYKKFNESKCRKPFILFIDRNILSSLLKFCETGSLKSKSEAQIVGLIMVWAELNDVSISAGLAIKEGAVQRKSQQEGLIELQKFLEVFDTYPGHIWLDVAEGRRGDIPSITYSQNPAENITVDYSDGGDHYDMAVATLLHIVQLYRNKEMSPKEKLQDLFQWMYDKLLVSEYLFVYAIMLFTGQEYIKAPKFANSSLFEKIVVGCENQAWDIAYLTNWSTLYSNTENYNEEFLFATNDVLLKRIFVNANGPYGYNGILYERLSKKDYNSLMDFIEEKMANRIKPDFGKDAHKYFQKLIDEEKQKILNLLKENMQ